MSARTIHIALTATLEGPARTMSDKALGNLVLDLLAIGQEDARSTLRNGEGKLREAERATNIEFLSINVSEG